MHDVKGFLQAYSSLQNEVLASYIDTVGHVIENAKQTLDAYHYRKLVDFLIDATARYGYE